MESEWCRCEFRSAHMQTLNDQNHRVIIIVLEDMPKNLDKDMQLSF